MQGKAIAAIGALLLFGGAFGLYFAYEDGNAGAAAGAWAAIIAGALAILGGLARFMGGFMAAQQSGEARYGATEVRLLVQCMGAIAAADGRIQGEEMATIARIHERVLGLRIDEDEIAEMLSGFDSSFDIDGAFDYITKNAAVVVIGMPASGVFGQYDPSTLAA